MFDCREGHSGGCELLREESTFLPCIVLPMTEQSLSRTLKGAVSFLIKCHDSKLTVEQQLGLL